MAFEKDNRVNNEKPKRCCGTCSINQRCTHPDKVYQAEAQEQELADLLKSPPKKGDGGGVANDTESELPSSPSPNPAPLSISSPSGKSVTTNLYPPGPNSDSEEDEPPSPQSPIILRTREQTKRNVQAHLREAVNHEGIPILVKIPFSIIDTEAWEKVARNYQSDPIGVAKKFKFMVKQHNPDWADIQLLLDAPTESEKQLKTAVNMAEDDCRITQEDVKKVLPLQDPEWDPNEPDEMAQLKRYWGFIIKGLERAIPKAINWSALYAIKPGPSQTPSEFLDNLQDAMRRYSTLDPGLEGVQQLVNLFLGQSTGDIRWKLQKIQGPMSCNLETLLDVAWRVYSNREEGYK